MHAPRLPILAAATLLTLGAVTFGPGRIVSAQSTVQLPSFSRFTYSGSVLVPVGGSTSLGGVSRSASSISRRGGRAIGAGVGRAGALGHAGASAHVTIIDHDAIDRQLRGLPPKSQGRSSASARPPRTAVVTPDAEGKALVRFARKQYLAGKHTSAFDAYRIAIETLSPRLATLATAEFKRVFPSEKRPVDIQPRPSAADDR
ncbi:hypothetical protein Mal15_53580 [Stieleria maiorica]|uniref:Uncharacterized protein n=1 Tax=Stieleria maiorica TaxID=2795974 RepID=A0A5B9MJ40_9BACT|nr:hypothetical protein [Stieleria maiorica]QEG01282.1 hypothetical protein Mal15_53580 [Stieleria maiorica]